MKRFAGKHLNNSFVCLAVLGLFGALLGADQYLRFDTGRKAKRLLKAREVATEPLSAVTAAASGDVFILDQLAIAGVDLGSPAGEPELTPLLAAIRSNQSAAVDYLLGWESVSRTIDHPAPDDGKNAFVCALSAGNFEFASRLRAIGASADVRLTKDTPWLVEAWKKGDWKLFDFLVSQGADVNEPGPEGLSLLALAVDRQDGERIDQLIAAGAKLDIKGVTGDSLVLESINRGDADLADWMLRAGAPVDDLGASGQTALLAAVRADSPALVELLLSHGADPNLAGPDRKAPLEIAVETQDIELMEVLLESGADAKARGVIGTAFQNRDLVSMKLLLRSGADPETRVEGGKTLLDAALAASSVPMARALLESGASPAGKLWTALKSEESSLAEMLLFFGADASERSPEGALPMEHALKIGSDDLIAALLENGANPNGKGANGEYFVATAIRQGNAIAAEALLDRGACIDGIMAQDGHSLLGWSIARKMTGVTGRLIDQGVDVRAREKSPASSSFTEAFTRSKTFRWHLQADSRLNTLMMATAQGDRETVEKLIAAGASKSDSSRRYLWPVSIAAWHADVPMMQILFGRDPDPDNQPRKVIVDLGSQRATLYENGRATYSTRVSTGKSGYRTPTGTYVITDKHRHHTSTLYDSSMPFFMRLSCAAFGLHQGVVPGYPASHGCIRVPYTGAKHLFSICEVGDVVEITY